MSILTSESPVALEHLDDHLKAILKVKLREFVHLSPCFADIPSIDMSRYGRSQALVAAQHHLHVVSHDDGCPNKQHKTNLRRRPVRPVVV
ncbi:MAG TPA: hypothetical protein V6C69_06145 [Trichormus sp.]|jgi:hypothetical protein